MGKPSREKGKRGEREFAKWLTANGHRARRGQQYDGIEGDDVVCPSLAAYHIEVKRVEALRLKDSLAQAIADARGRIPVVAHRRNQGEWMIIMRASDWIKTV